MPDHEPFDGTVPFVFKMLIYRDTPWAAYRPGTHPTSERFATWREAMNYATKEDHR